MKRLFWLFLLTASTLSAQCVTPTVTVGPTGISDATGTQLIVTWTTDVASDTMLIYGLFNAGTATSVTDTGGVTSHSVTITGLMPGQVYQWAFRSRAISGGSPCALPYWAWSYDLDNSTTMDCGGASPCPPAGSGFTYGINLYGPTYVTQTNGIYFKIYPYTLTGTYGPSNLLTLTLTGLPPYSSITWPDITYWGLTTLTQSQTTIPNDTLLIGQYGWYPTEVYIKTNVGGTTPTGNYTVTITGTVSGLSNVVVTWPLHVVSSSAPFSGTALTPGTPSSYPAIPSLSTYLASADTYGQQTCAQDGQPGYRTIRANNNASATISSVSRTSGTTTVTTSSPFPTGALGFNTGNSVTISGVTNTSFNTTSAAITVTGASTFTYTNAGTDASSSGGTAQNNLTPVNPSTTYASWFYDGVQVYYNVENMLNNGRNWGQCRTNVKQVYRDGYVFPHSGNVPVYMQFSQGYYTDYHITGDSSDLTLLTDFATYIYSPYHGNYVDIGYLQRETAYVLRNLTDAVASGINVPIGLGTTQTSAFVRDFAEDHVLGMLDQACLTQNAQFSENFMFGLQAEALVHYYNVANKDPRIPPALACLANWMYSTQWSANETGDFPYDTTSWKQGLTGAVTGSCYASLNNLISPMYAWLFKYTGSSTYQTEGDNVFNYGTNFSATGCSGNPSSYLTFPSDSDGKTYSQQYYWGTDYVQLRSPMVYVAQTAGTFTGGTLCNGQTAIVPASITWTAGNTYVLCGTIAFSAGATGLHVTTNGTSGNSITILFDSGAVLQAPYWSGGTNSEGGAIDLDSRSYVVVDGGTNGLIQATLNGTTGATCPGGSCTQHQGLGIGVWVHSASNITVKNLTIGDLYDRTGNTSDSPGGGGIAPPVGIEVYDSNTISVHNNSIHDLNTGIFIQSVGTLTNLDIYSNTIYNINMGIGGGSGNSGAQMSNFNIYNNLIHGTAKWDCTGDCFHHDGIDVWNVHSGAVMGGYFNIYNNKVYDIGTVNNGFCTASIYLDMETSPASAYTTTYIFNNILYGGPGCGGSNGGDGEIYDKSGKGQFLNNTIVEGAPVSGESIGTITTATSGTGQKYINDISNAPKVLESYSASISSADYNDWYNLSGTMFNYNGTNYSSFSTWKSSTGFDAHTITGNPNLDANYKPQSGSPVIGAGTNLYSTCNGQPNPGLGALCFDKAGVARPTSTAWDIGAYQFVSSTPQAATPTFLPTAGGVNIGQTVTISDTTPSSTITYCFDTNNTCTPSTVGTSYTITTTGYLRAFATASGYTQSVTGSAHYTINQVASGVSLMAKAQ